MSSLRTAWRNLMAEWSALRRVRRQQRALDLIVESQRIDPEVLASVINTTLEFAAERVRRTGDTGAGPWGARR